MTPPTTDTPTVYVPLALPLKEAQATFQALRAVGEAIDKARGDGDV